MILALAFAAQMMATLPPAARNTVSATAFACTFTQPDGVQFKISGILPAFLPGRDPNASQGVPLTVDAMPVLAGRGSATVSSDSGAMFRDFQISMRRGEASYVANLKLRSGSDGIGWMTVYTPSTPPQPYRYFAAGHCQSDFQGKPLS